MLALATFASILLLALAAELYGFKATIALLILEIAAWLALQPKISPHLLEYRRYVEEKTGKRTRL